MPGFAPGEWRSLRPYLDHALDVDAEERVAWLRALETENPTLAKQLQDALQEHGALIGEHFLESAAGAAAAPQSLAGQTFGAYTLEAPLGQGGMGTVWLARRSDGRFEGQFAVKLLNLALLGGAAEERFRREGTLAARMSHPNIAHLIDAGVTAAGQPYLVLEHVQGRPIDAYCNERSFDVKARVELFLQVLAAVAHAHANLVVHRDIKPSNVLVTDAAQVKLLDFGIAKLLEEHRLSTAAGELTGTAGNVLTPAYAAPEQVSGSPITVATDIYSLGVLLYVLLTGEHPAQSELQSAASLIKAIAEAEPPLPSLRTAANRKLSRALRGDLDTIIGKALKKNPAERYVSATAFADDLRRYLRQEPIGARPDTLAYRARKFLQRNRTAVALSAVAAIATAAGIVSTAMQARTARSERDFALRQGSLLDETLRLDSFVLSEAAPLGKSVTMEDLLERAESLIRRQQGTDEALRVFLLRHIAGQYMILGKSAKAREIMTQVHSRSRELKDPSTRALASCSLAQALALGDQFDSAARAGELVQEGLRELPVDPRFALDRKYCLLIASAVAGRLGQGRQALAYAQDAEQTLSQAPFHSKMHDLEVVAVLAGAYRRVGQIRATVQAFEQAIKGFDAVGHSGHSIVILNNWGVAMYEWGQPIEAERLFRETIERQSSLGREISTIMLVNYARSLTELGRLAEAAIYAERAYNQSRAAADIVNMNHALLTRTAIYRTQGDLRRAGDALREIEPTFGNKLPSGHLNFGNLASQRALDAQARGDSAAALGFAQQAVEIAAASMKKSGEGGGYLQKFLVIRSGIELDLGKLEQAEEDARRALQVLPELLEAGTFSANVGRAYVALGHALQLRGKADESSAAFRSSVPHLVNALGPEHPEAQIARQPQGPEVPR